MSINPSLKYHAGEADCHLIGQLIRVEQGKPYHYGIQHEDFSCFFDKNIFPLENPDEYIGGWFIISIRSIDRVPRINPCFILQPQSLDARASSPVNGLSTFLGKSFRVPPNELSFSTFTATDQTQVATLDLCGRSSSCGPILAPCDNGEGPIFSGRTSSAPPMVIGWE